MRQRSEPQAPEQPGASDETGERLVELVLAEHAERPPARRIHGVVVGRLAGLGPRREVLVDFAGNMGDTPIAARSTVPIAEGDQGRAVALMFEEGDVTRPLLLGLIHEPELPAVIEAEPATESTEAQELQVEADGERVVVSADKELVLRCGKASITLTQAGKIIIRGAYVLTRSSGVNRIQGGSVQIN
ncbi:MAG: DUF6484 domain-containing protein [Minicystis sp.]